jgi:MFS family permease
MTPELATAQPDAAPKRTAQGPALWRIMGSVLLPFALAHCVSYLYRNVNTVIYPDLVRDVGLDANGLGLLTGVYMATFALAQLPVGMALDRWGPRRVQLPMLCLSALGGLLFAMADTFTGLLLARGLIGLGVSASLMAALKASSLWVPAERQPLSASLLMAVGSLGAMASTAPMQFAVDLVGWRWGFAGIACCALAVAVLIGTVVPEHPRPAARRQHPATGQQRARHFRVDSVLAHRPVHRARQRCLHGRPGAVAGALAARCGGN